MKCFVLFDLCVDDDDRTVVCLKNLSKLCNRHHLMIQRTYSSKDFFMTSEYGINHKQSSTAGSDVADIVHSNQYFCAIFDEELSWPLNTKQINEKCQQWVYCLCLWKYTTQILTLSKHDYWDRLKLLKLNSQERRMETYRIICVWKIMEQRVPTWGIKHHTSQRKTRPCRIPKIDTQASCVIKTIREGRVIVCGPNLFNARPQDTRNKTDCSTDSFKHKLDKYLQTIPDLPRIPGYTNLTIMDTNSLLEMTKPPTMATTSTLDDQGRVNDLASETHTRTELNETKRNFSNLLLMMTPLSNKFYK